MLQQQELDELSNYLNSMQPMMVNRTLQLYQSDSTLQARYGIELRNMAQHGVSNFVEILLAAVELNQPKILADQLKWLENLLHTRQIDSRHLNIMLEQIRIYFKAKLPVAQREAVLAVLDQAVEQLGSVPK